MMRLAASRSAGVLARGGARRSASALVSLEEEFKGTPKLAPKAAAAATTEVSKLSNGIPVVARATGGPAAAVAVLVKSGARNEPAGAEGATLLLQNMAFKTTERCSTLYLNRALELAACYASASAGREVTLFSVECPPGSAATAMDALAQTVLAPKLRPWELDEVAAKVDAVDLRLFTGDARLLLDEAVHAAAFGEATSLGRPFHVPCKMTPAALAAFAGSEYAAGRMVLAGAGVPLQELVALGEAHFGAAPTGGSEATVPSPYVGGDARVKAEGPATHVAVAFSGAAAGSKDAAAAAVLKALLQARLATSPAAAGAAAFSASYADAGVFGTIGAAPPAGVPALVDAMCAALKSLAATEAAPAELAAAVAVTRVGMLAALEQPGAAVAALAASVAAGADPAAADGRSVMSVTAGAAKALAAAMLKTPVSVACVGETVVVPSRAAIAKKF